MFLKKNFEKKILLIILSLATFLRLWGTLRGDFAYTYDVGRDFLVVRQIVVEHKLTLLGPTTGIQGIFYGPWWYYFLTIPFFLFRGNPIGIALFMGLIGIAVVLLSFYLGKLFWGFKDKIWPLILVSLFAFSKSHIEASSQIWSPNLVPFFMIFWFLSFWAFLKDKRFSSFFMGFFSMLVLESEVAFGIFFISTEIAALIFLFRRKLPLKKIFLFFLGALIIFSPQIVFELRHEFPATRNFLGFLDKSLIVSQKVNLLLRLKERLMAFIAVWHSTLARGDSFLGSALLILTVYALVFCREKVSRIEKQIVHFLILMIAGLYFLFSFYGGNFWMYYLIGVPTIYIFLFIFLLRRFYLVVPKKAFWLGLIFYLVFLAQPMKIYTTLKQPHWEGDAAVYHNVKAVVEEVYQDADGEPFNYRVYTPPLIPYTYQYLFLWLSGNKYHNFPSSNQEQLLYFIVEPNAYQPDLSREWLLNYQSEGKLIFEKIMAGGIILQKKQRK